jgi:hypothetical protein
VVFLYEFCNAAGAAAYGTRGSELIAASGLTVVPFDTAGVGSGFAIQNDTLVAAFVVAPADTSLVEAIAYAAVGTDPAVVQQRAIDTAAAQLARL